jgi:hypothetical protein
LRLKELRKRKKKRKRKKDIGELGQLALESRAAKQEGRPLIKFRKLPVIKLPPPHRAQKEPPTSAEATQ